MLKIHLTDADSRVTLATAGDESAGTVNFNAIRGRVTDVIRTELMEVSVDYFMVQDTDVDSAHFQYLFTADNIGLSDNLNNTQIVAVAPRLFKSTGAAGDVDIKVVCSGYQERYTFLARPNSFIDGFDFTITDDSLTKLAGTDLAGWSLGLTIKEYVP